MAKALCFLLFLIISNSISAQNILSGTVENQENIPLQNAKIYNTKTGISTITNSDGSFGITAFPDDEIVVLKDNFQRKNFKVSAQDFQNQIKIILIAEIQKIEEVKIANKPTGDLGKDLAHYKADNSVENLKNEIGLPQSKKPQREKVPEVKDAVAFVGIGVAVNLNNVYKLASGEARRMKRRYAYEDLRKNVDWILSKNGVEFFTELNIPAERIQEFLEFALSVDPRIAKMISAGNLTRVNGYLEETSRVFLKRLRE